MQYARSNKLLKIFPFLIILSVCSCGVLSNLDFDLRGNEYDTSDAVRKAMKTRPLPDSRGIISYTTYEVAVAQKGDTIKSIADRLGLKSKNVAKYNGMSTQEILNEGQLISLPNKIDSKNNLEKKITPTLNKVDVKELAFTAIEKSSDSKTKSKTTTGKLEDEPIRHKVSRGETAFTISRLYKVSIRSLADWNGLDSNFTIREGQYLLIPLPADNKISGDEIVSNDNSTEVLVPPSSSKPLPNPINKQEFNPTLLEAPKNTEPSKRAIFSYPVKGKIIRDYVKNKTDGIDISAPAGTPIMAAEKGIVAAITSDTQEVPIIVLKHEGNLLTVYAGIGDIAVKEKDEVSRSQVIGKIQPGNPSFLHFEVRRGFDSIDPMEFLD